MLQNIFTLLGKAMARFGLNLVILLSSISKMLPKSIDQVTDEVIRYITFGMIDFYKHYVDPYKRGKCAHRLLHGGLSCSEYISSVASEYGISEAIPLVQQRYADCRDAHLLLKQDLLAYDDHNSCVDVECH